MDSQTKTENIKVNPEDLNKLLKNAGEIQEVIRPHIVIENKINIWIRIANNIFPPARNFIFLILSSIYFTKKVILEDILSKMIDFAFNDTHNHWNLLIICSTIICFYFIKNKYK